ncbi:MAG TPA: RNA polymerase sigma factor [Blastocatellia bacterium]|nr:RNA polymerase sigma factor [Blastocatellia bacterium]
MDSPELQAELERHHQASYGWALCCCSHDSHQAESVLQDVYLKILGGKARFDGKSSFRTWLFAVIRKTAADERRRNLLTRLRLTKHERSAGQDAPADRPDEIVYRAQIQALFRQALARLPKRQQEVLELVFYHDLSLAEAAKVMGVSVGSARTHYDRGKKRLRQWLDESEVLNESRAGRKQDQRAIP